MTSPSDPKVLPIGPELPDAWKPKRSLFELTEEFLALEALLEASGGELTPEVEAWREANAEAFTEKVDALVWYAKTLKGDAEFYREQADELAHKAKVAENKIARLKEYAAVCLDRLGVKAVKGKVYAIAYQKNGGLPPLRLLTPDPLAFPESCRVVTLSNSAIRELLTGGTLPEGLAQLDPPSESLRFK